MATDLAPLAGTVGGGFCIGFIKLCHQKSNQVGSSNSWALAYMEYQRILSVDWHKVQAVSQNGIDWVADAITHVSSTIDASHIGTLSNVGIPLASSVSAGFVLGLARG
jgi:uncharacterized membrane protein (Fun14 family)